MGSRLSRRSLAVRKPILNAQPGDALKIAQKEKDLEWSFFSPAMQLMDEGKSGGKFKLGLDAPIRNAKGEHKVTMGDYAHAALDEIEHPKHVRKRFTIGSTA